MAEDSASTEKKIEEKTEEKTEEPPAKKKSSLQHFKAGAVPAGRDSKDAFDWKCESCGYKNFEKNQDCKKCHTPKNIPPRGPRPGPGGIPTRNVMAVPPPFGAPPDWHCDYCLKMVRGDMEICPHCNPHLFEGPRPNRMGGPPGRGMRGGMPPRGRGNRGSPMDSPGGHMFGKRPMPEEGHGGIADRLLRAAGMLSAERGGHRGRGNPMMRGGPGMRGHPMLGMRGAIRGRMGDAMFGRGGMLGRGGMMMERRGMMMGRGGMMMGRGGMMGTFQGPTGNEEHEFDNLPDKFDPFRMNPIDGPLQFNKPVPIPEKNKLSEQAKRVKEYREKIQKEKEEETLKALGLTEKSENKSEDPIEINLPGSAGFSSFKNSLQEYLDKARLALASYTIKRKTPDEKENEYQFKAKKMKKEELMKKIEEDKGCLFMCTLEFDGNTISTTVPMGTDKDACQRAAFTALKFLKYIPPNAPFEEEVYKGKKIILDESSFTETGSSINKPVTMDVQSAPMEFGWEPRQQVS